MINIITAVIVLSGIATSFLFKGTFHKVIAIVTGLPCFIGGYINTSPIGVASIGIVATGTLLVVWIAVYAGKKIIANKFKRISVIIFGVMFAVFIIDHLFKVMHWPSIFSGFATYGVIFSLILYTIGIIRNKPHFTKEISYMLVWFGWVTGMI